MAKIFFTYEQQLNKLQQEKDLIIPDTDAAKLTLEKLSYYSLIGGYKELFKHTPSQKYIYGVAFDEIVAFYYFDEELRSLFMKYILHVERHIKSLLSYHFCEKYGEKDTEYLDINNYTLTKKIVHKSIAWCTPCKRQLHYQANIHIFLITQTPTEMFLCGLL